MDRPSQSQAPIIDFYIKYGATLILGINGDASQMGQRTRRGGSKSRLLSPPPQPPTTNGNSNSNIPNIQVF